MNKQHFKGFFLLTFFGNSYQNCANDFTLDQKQILEDLKRNLDQVRKDIMGGVKEDALYSGGLIKTLIGVRLEILKTNEALIEQRIHVLESGAPITLVVNATIPDMEKATALAKEIEIQRAKLEVARSEANRWSGGLVKSMAETAAVTEQYTLAILEQQFFIAKYGFAIPAATGTQADSVGGEKRGSSEINSDVPTTGTSVQPDPRECLKIEVFDSSVLSSNDVYTELAWKVDFSNTCADALGVRVTFTIFDKDEFELDSDFKDVYLSAGGTGKVRGKMLVSPPEKARRMARHGVSLSLL